MAGYIDKIGDSQTVFTSISKRLKELSSLGMKYDDMIIRNSKAVGLAEAEFGQGGFNDEKFLFTLAQTDIGNKKYIAYFDKEIKTRIEFLQKFASNGEIEFILDTICDESLVYDDKNYFAYPSRLNLGDLKEEVFEKIDDSFKKIYNAFKFTDDISAWNLLRKFLVEGFLAFEIIYNDKQDAIIGFKEIDPLQLRPDVEKDANGNWKKMWTLYPDDTHLKRQLADSQVIYISYAPQIRKGIRISYLERLVRSFNLLRIIENSRVIWNIMHSTFRLKMTIPVGTKAKAKQKESLAELMSLYKEDISLDFDSGELSVNGKANMQFYKNYLLPQKNGETPEIDTLDANGPELNDSDIIKYFSTKMYIDSKIPMSRFPNTDGNGGGSWGLGSDSVDREEIRFSKFIKRVRSIWQEILVKPVFIQFCISNPEFKDDLSLKSSMGLHFNSDNLFEELKNYDILQKRYDAFTFMKDIQEDDMATPYFAVDFLIREFNLFDEDALNRNKDWKKKIKKDNGNIDPLNQIDNLI